MAQFRSRLVHYYEKNDSKIIFRIVKNRQKDFLAYIKEIKNFINKTSEQTQA